MVELPILLGVAYALWQGRGVERAIALNSIGLGAIKLVTDLSDGPDDLVALAGLAGGVAVLMTGAGPFCRRLPPPFLGRVLGAGVLVVGVVKLLRDPYDPFDLLLADLCVVTGAWLLARVVSPPEAAPVPRPVPANRG